MKLSFAAFDEVRWNEKVKETKLSKNSFREAEATISYHLLEASRRYRRSSKGGSKSEGVEQKLLDEMQRSCFRNLNIQFDTFIVSL